MRRLRKGSVIFAEASVLSNGWSEKRPYDVELEEQMRHAKQEIREVEERRHEFFFHSQVAQWTQIGDRVTGEFFEVAGPQHHHAGADNSKNWMGC